MDWWIWTAAIIAAVLLVIDWMIVMGADPKKRKGSGKHGGHQNG